MPVCKRAFPFVELRIPLKYAYLLFLVALHVIHHVCTLTLPLQDQTAKMVEQHLHPKIFHTTEFSRGEINAALIKGFEDTDRIVVDEANKANLMHGSTGVVGLILDGKVHIANIGDSEGVLVSVEYVAISDSLIKAIDD